jgi:phosphatidylethanolamine/phosphatidyl-N-methylethanolamine N-methyltransferase
MPAYAEFLRGLVDDPRGVSAPTPSGPILSAVIAAQVDPARPGPVLELGPGTGVVTEALVARGISPARLVLIESGDYFCERLRARFPRAKVCAADAFAFEQCLPDGVVLAAVVSGVPLLNFPMEKRVSLIERALDAQGPGGRFIQLSYGWHPAAAPGPRLRVKKKLVWRNLPPAHVWTYRRPE